MIHPCDKRMFDSNVHACWSVFNESMETSGYRRGCAWPAVKRYRGYSWESSEGMVDGHLSCLHGPCLPPQRLLRSEALRGSLGHRVFVSESRLSRGRPLQGSASEVLCFLRAGPGPAARHPGGADRAGYRGHTPDAASVGQTGHVEHGHPRLPNRLKRIPKICSSHTACPISLDSCVRVLFEASLVCLHPCYGKRSQ